MGKPEKNLTPKDLEEIETLAGLGMRFEDIACLKGMSDDTLRKYAGEQLQRGKSKAKAAIMQTAYKMAASGKTPAMTIFWLKTQAKWHERMTDNEQNAILPSDNLEGFLANTIAQLTTGNLDPQIAQTVSTLCGMLLKAQAQNDLAQRLDTVESLVKGQDPLLSSFPSDEVEDTTFEFIQQDPS